MNEDKRTIQEFSMTELNNEITRCRMLAEQAGFEWSEAELAKERFA